MLDSSFRQRVYEIVARIPSGRVMTYGQVAAVCGSPQAARAVGQIAHFGDAGIPWHRVVNANGQTASGFWPDGRLGQSRLLRDENIKVKDNKLNLVDYLWNPKT